MSHSWLKCLAGALLILGAWRCHKVAWMIVFERREIVKMPVPLMGSTEHDEGLSVAELDVGWEEQLCPSSTWAPTCDHRRRPLREVLLSHHQVSGRHNDRQGRGHPDPFGLPCMGRHQCALDFKGHRETTRTSPSNSGNRSAHAPELAAPQSRDMHRDGRIPYPPFSSCRVSW